MNQDEAEAVLAHEVSHVANGDRVTMALSLGGVNTFVIFLSRVIGHFVDRIGALKPAAATGKSQSCHRIRKSQLSLAFS